MRTTHSRYYECRRCRRPHKSKRANQVMCPPCRFLDDLEYWDEIKTRVSKCSKCAGPFRRACRNDQVCADCLRIPATQSVDCLCCGGKDLGAYRQWVPICRWCLLDAAPGVRTKVLDIVTGIFAKAVIGQRRGESPKVEVGIAPAADKAAPRPKNPSAEPEVQAKRYKEAYQARMLQLHGPDGHDEIHARNKAAALKHWDAIGEHHWPSFPEARKWQELRKFMNLEAEATKGIFKTPRKAGDR